MLKQVMDLMSLPLNKSVMIDIEMIYTILD